jgi:hypothetical protein
MGKKDFGKIVISKEDLRVKPRSGVRPSRRHKDKKSEYTRKPKHTKRSSED